MNKSVTLNIFLLVLIHLADLCYTKTPEAKGQGLGIREPSSLAAPIQFCY